MSESATLSEPTPDASSSFLGDITGSNVIVKLNSGLEYHGMIEYIYVTASSPDQENYNPLMDS